jgi:hypothetical protein
MSGQPPKPSVIRRPNRSCSPAAICDDARATGASARAAIDAPDRAREGFPQSQASGQRVNSVFSCTRNETKQNMKIIHLALVVSLSTGPILSAGAQQRDAAGNAAVNPNPTASPSPSQPKAHKKHRKGHRHRGHEGERANYPMPGTAPSPSPAGKKKDRAKSQSGAAAQPTVAPQPSPE